MDRRSHVAFIALAFLGTGLAGCIENPSWLNAGDVEVSALENKRLADAAALEWRPEAKLVGVMAFELADSVDARIDADPDPGNGLAPAWWYVYCDAAAMSAQPEAADEGAYARGGEAHATATTMAANIRAFKVSADGTVSSEEDAEAFAAGMDHSMVSPIEGWTVDSDDALAAASKDEGFARVAQGYNASVVEGVAHYDGATTWWVSAMSADGFVVATVDAATGELLSVMPIDMESFAIPEFHWGAANPQLAAPPVHLEGEGTAAPGDEPLEMPFTIGAEMEGVLLIEFDAELPSDGLHWAILDHEGEIVEVDHVSSWWRGSDSYEAELEIEEPGEYTFVLYYMENFPMGRGVPLPLGGSVDYWFELHLEPAQH